MRIDTTHDRGELATLGDEWDSVLAESSQDNPFLRHHWIETWWDVYGKSATLSVLTCRDGGRLIGVMPLYTTLAGHLPPARTARFIGDHGVGSTALAPFALRDAEDTVFESFVRRVREADSGWDQLDLRFIDPRTSFFRHLESTGRTRTFDGGDACPRIRLPNDWDTYLTSLSKHRRHEVRRLERRAKERGLEPEVIRDPRELPSAAADLLRLHEGRLRTKLGPGYAVSPEYEQFTTNVMERLLGDGSLRLLFMRHGERRVAGLYLLRHGDTMYAEQSGFDESDGHGSAISALWAHAIRGAIEEGCTSLDMLLGEQNYKAEWGATDTLRLSTIHAYNSTVRGVLRNGRDAVAAATGRT